MEQITVILLTACFCICLGMIIGMFISFKIDHDYILGMNDNMKEYFTSMIKLEDEYFNETLLELGKAIDSLNKYEIPVWNKTEELLPNCDGLYYGKIKDNQYGENAMWKVVYKDNKWSLSGYPDTVVDISEWTDIY